MLNVQNRGGYREDSLGQLCPANDCSAPLNGAPLM